MRRTDFFYTHCVQDFPACQWLWVMTLILVLAVSGSDRLLRADRRLSIKLKQSKANFFHDYQCEKKKKKKKISFSFFLKFPKCGGIDSLWGYLLRTPYSCAFWTDKSHVSQLAPWVVKFSSQTFMRCELLTFLQSLSIQLQYSTSSQLSNQLLALTKVARRHVK